MDWRITRREALFSAAGLLVGQASRPVRAAAPAKAKSVIQIWMWGGPAHLDTFDPKPEAGNDYCGPLNAPIETNVKGIRICELLPLLAKQADKYSLIRSMTHGVNAHETASYTVQTGRISGGHDVYPSVGAVVSLFKGCSAGYKGLIPPYVVLTQPQGRFSEAGFLGNKYKPFATGGDPAQPRFAVEGVVAQGVNDQRQRARRDYLHQLDLLGRALPDDPQIKASKEAEAQAYELILGDAGKVFDLTQEKDEMRDRYGRNTFGQSCLLARRLIEGGVRYVTVNHFDTVFNLTCWDMHADGGGLDNTYLDYERHLCPQFDWAFTALIEDLEQRGLLEETVVAVLSEFGRTPQLNPRGGRDHYPAAWTNFLCGGNIRGGQVIGSTDKIGSRPHSNPIEPPQILASIYHGMGINLDTTMLPGPGERPVRLIDAEPIRQLFS